MCQILVLTNTSKVKDTIKLINTAAVHLLDTEIDGFGYAIQGQKGVFGERTNRSEFESRLKNWKLQVKLPIVEETVNMFGKASKNVGAGLFHGRTSTNDKTLLNTHPIQKNNWTLIHNGVVTNQGPQYKKITTNDTEDIVQFMSTCGIEGVEKNLTGYYAFAALDAEGNLHVVRDNVATLHVALNRTLGCHIFGTTKDLVKNVSEVMKWKIGPVEEVKENIYMIFNPEGLMVDMRYINPRGFSDKEAKHAGRSLGRDLSLVKTGFDKYSEDTRYSDYWKGLDDVDDVERTSYYEYLAEIDTMDSSYTVFNPNGQSIELNEFRKMTEVQMMNCTLVRSDGTIVNPFDYKSNKLYQGRTA